MIYEIIIAILGFIGIILSGIFFKWIFIDIPRNNLEINLYYRKSKDYPILKRI